MKKEIGSYNLSSNSNNNEYPVADLSLFDYIYQVHIPERLKNSIEYTHDLYEEYYQKIVNTFNKKQLKDYLKAIKNMDFIYNQTMEREDSTLLSLYRALFEKDATAMDLLIENRGNKLTKEDFICLHDLLLEGTTSYQKLGLRENDSHWVGSVNTNNEREVDYYPILKQDIDPALTKLLNYYNDNLDTPQSDYDKYLKPIIYHGLIAGLQMFRDGNTRYGRTIQHAELWGMLNDTLPEKTSSPILYASHQYAPYRAEYRELIKNLVVQKDEQAWNEWFLFNLNKLQDGIYKSDNNVDTLKQYIKK